MKKELCMEDTFSEIYHRHIDCIYKICFLYMKNKQDAEDAVQSTFLKLIQSGKEFKCPEHEKAWLIVVASNYCKNQLKHWWKKKVVDIDSISEIPDNQLPTTMTPLLEQVLSLSENYKLSIYLYYYEGYKTAEIADMLHRKESTVRSWLCTGRRLLKLSLGDDFL